MAACLREMVYIWGIIEMVGDAGDQFIGEMCNGRHG